MNKKSFCSHPKNDKVIAATQWALPQVDVYVGLLAPFASSLHFVAGSSRSAAAGRRVHRHSQANGGEAFGVVVDVGDKNYDMRKDGAYEIQVRQRRPEQIVDPPTHSFAVSSNSLSVTAYSFICCELRRRLPDHIGYPFWTLWSHTDH